MLILKFYFILHSCMRFLSSHFLLACSSKDSKHSKNVSFCLLSKENQNRKILECSRKMRGLVFQVFFILEILFAVIFSGQTSVNLSPEGSYHKYLHHINNTNSLQEHGNNKGMQVEKIKSLLESLPVSTLKEIQNVANKDADMGRRYILKMLSKEDNKVNEGTLKSSFIDSLLKDLKRRKLVEPRNQGSANFAPNAQRKHSSPNILLENFEVFQIPSDLFLQSLPTTTEKPIADKYLIFDHVIPPYKNQNTLSAITTSLPLDKIPHLTHPQSFLNKGLKLDKTSDLATNINYVNSQSFEPFKLEDWQSKIQPGQQAEHYTIQLQPNQNPPTSFQQIFQHPPNNMEENNAQNLQWNQMWNQQNNQQLWQSTPVTPMVTYHPGFPQYNHPNGHAQRFPTNPQVSYNPESNDYTEPGFPWLQYYPQQNNYDQSPYNQYSTIDNQGGWSPTPGWFPPEHSGYTYGWPRPESEESKEKKKGIFKSLHKAIFGKHKDKFKDKDKHKGKYKDKYKEEGWGWDNPGKDKHKGDGWDWDNQGKGSSNEGNGWDDTADSYSDTYDKYSKKASDMWEKAKSKIHDHFKEKKEKKKAEGHHAYTASQKLLGISISILAFLAFGAYIVMLLFQTAVTTLTFPLLSGIIALLSGDGGGQLVQYFIGRSLNGDCIDTENDLDCQIKQGLQILKAIVLNFV